MKAIFSVLFLPLTVARPALVTVSDIIPSYGLSVLAASKRSMDRIESRMAMAGLEIKVDVCIEPSYVRCQNGVVVPRICYNLEGYFDKSRLSADFDDKMRSFVCWSRC
ncbi:Protein of unknown function [Pyronema omphalodes CBS 100304]|uniref:Uncharacterized protein n=1 Tax=Pyronema omphalodes (strain CBS 100304) TaxID=1076935 RepID=U4LI91_PYROM|nr:Protein of unknown function [Pyronema omphalodes CBS 100304]